MTCPHCGQEQPAEAELAGRTACAYCGAPLPIAEEGAPGAPAPAAPLAALRPMSIAELLDRSFKLYKSNFATIIGTYMVYAGPLIVLNAAYTILFNMAMPGAANPFAVWSEMFRHPGSPPPMPEQQMRPEYMVLAYGVMGLMGLWALVNGWALGATIWAAAAAHLGYHITVKDAIRAASLRFWSLVGAWIVIGLAVGTAFTLGICLCGFPGALVWTALCLTLPVIVIEGQTMGPALSRGHRLVKPDFWRILGWSLLLFIVLVSAPGVIVQLLGLGIGGILTLLGAPNAGGVVSNVLYTVLNSIITPIFYIGLTLIYFDQRSRLEYFDVQYAAQALGLAPPAPPER